MVLVSINDQHFLLGLCHNKTISPPLRVQRPVCDSMMMLVHSEIMGHRCCRAVLSHISLMFPRALHLPLQTDVPLRDRHPLFVQTQACPVLCCTCVCVCLRLCVLLRVDLCVPVSGFSRRSRKSEEKQNCTVCKQPATKLEPLRL